MSIAPLAVKLCLSASKHHDMKSEIQRADPEKRRKVAVALAVSTAVGALLIALSPFLISWVKEDPEIAFSRLVYVPATLLALCVPMIFFARSVWTVGRDTIDAQRFPPPGEKVIKDTVILTGPKAARRGQLMQWFSILLVLFSVAPPALLWLMIRMLIDAD